MLSALPLKNIKIADPFWSRYTDLVTREIIPYQWDALNNRIADAKPSNCIENFKIAAGEAKGKFHGVVFQDTDVAKWLEAVGYSLAANPDSELEARADAVIDLIGRAQCADGYINTYYTLNPSEHRFGNLTEGHELYTAGHLIEAAVAYYEGTSKDTFLKIVCRFADLICQVFGQGKTQIPGYPGHQEIELALIRLYRVTGKRDYLDTAKYFIDARGVGDNYFLKEMAAPDFKHIFPEFEGYLPLYSQSHLSVKMQKTAEGHAVRAVYMYCAMADLADEYGDEELMAACDSIWQNIVSKRMFITGGIGSSGLLERFTTDYDLPNDRNYSETCASIGLALFGLRMARIKQDARYIDVVEQALYNTVLSGLALDGKSFFYVNPLEVWPANCLDRTSLEHVKPVRQKWFGVACCPPNIARTLASLGQYLYSVEDDALYVNLYISNQTEVTLAGGNRQVEMLTEFPFGRECTIKIGKGIAGFTLGLRIPSYARGYTVSVDGIETEVSVVRGFGLVQIPAEGCEVKISFDFAPRFIRAHPKVRSDGGKLCLMRGPLVYALEEVDNGSNLAAVFVSADTEIKEHFDPELLGGVMTLSFDGYRIQETSWDPDVLYSEQKPVLESVPLKAVPYCLWNNRGGGEMIVWMKEKL